METLIWFVVRVLPDGSQDRPAAYFDETTARRLLGKWITYPGQCVTLCSVLVDPEGMQ